MQNIIYILISVIIAAFFAVFALSKCYFLASYRIGFLMLVSNLVYEVIERKLHWGRGFVDTVLMLAVTGGSFFCFDGITATAVALSMGFIWISALCYDNALLKRPSYKMQQSLRGQVPLPLPDLLISVRGPILKRKNNKFNLGVWPVGLEQKFKVFILNSGAVRGQLPLSVEIDKDDCIELNGIENKSLQTPEPGDISELDFSLKAIEKTVSASLRINIKTGDFNQELKFEIKRIVDSGQKIKSAEIKGWKYGTESAFVWRGDQDLYDPATFQSEDGLQITLGLAKRYRFPSSLMLSSGLSLNEDAHKEFCKHFGWDRKSEEIPGFIDFLKNKVDKQPEQEWPTKPDAEFAAEIGNHMHLHYGTHAAADPGNKWKSHAKICDGEYDWTEPAADSFTEQRDNALKCSEMFSEFLEFKPASFTIPSDVRDSNTSRAIEASGLEVGSETDATKLEKLINLKPPHHPEGCEKFVELPRMHPRDPQNASQLAMLKFWVGKATRTGRALVFLAHHHLTRYRDESSMKMTEELLRHVIKYNYGGIYIGTMTAVGRYWRDVLSPKTKQIHIETEDNKITITNKSNRVIEGIPGTVQLDDGGRYVRIVDLKPGESVDLM